MSRLLLVVAFGLCAGPANAIGREQEPGGYSLAMRAGTTVSAEANGFADVENGVPVEGRTMFRIASLTKQFTAVAVLLLVEEGRLSLEDTLARVLPDCPLVWRAITIKQLLSQTSGLTADMSPILAHAKDDFTARELIAPYATRALETTPGTMWRYSNLNYWILGVVIEHVTSTSYADFVRKRVLAPAGIRATRYGSTVDIIPQRARGYTRNKGDGWKNVDYFSSTIGYAAGGFVSSPDEMVRWYMALSQGKVLSRAMVDAAATEARTNDGAGTGYGLGWYVGRLCGMRVLHHGGSSPGFVSYIYWQPETATYAGVFLNHDDGGEPQAQAAALMKRTLGC